MFANSMHLENFLRSEFSNVSENFNVVHINAQSLSYHWQYFYQVFTGQDIHAILVSETWLKPKSICFFPGYTIIHNDRIHQRGGGVAIFLRKNIPYEEVSRSTQPPPSDAGEHLFVEIELNGFKLLLGVYYGKPKLNYLASFEDLLANVTRGREVIILGDFNTDLLRTTKRSVINFKSVIEKYGLHLAPPNATHLAKNQITPTLLDLMLVSSVNSVAKHGQCPAPGFSRHDLIYLSYRNKTTVTSTFLDSYLDHEHGNPREH